uniref:Beta-1,3-galactosyltransferase 7 n=1 Tax=Tanacetum cinerariifolium TaxID=118510 RepID=A0A6L2J6S4_TANCI|nr:beta-1,3-galactosyltransferase 7 [Tanacetum cinerariifolium]
MKLPTRVLRHVKAKTSPGVIHLKKANRWWVLDGMILNFHPFGGASIFLRVNEKKTKSNMNGNQTLVEVNRSDVRANKTDGGKSRERKKAFMVIGISSKRRRDLIRETWMPSGITLFTGGTTTATTSSAFKEM